MTLADATLPDLPLSYVNPAFEALTGYGAEEAVGRNCRFLQGPETDREAVRRISDAITQKTATSTMLLNYRKDGAKFWNRFQLSPVRDDSGKVTAFLGVQLDATYDVAAEKVEQERQKFETLGRLAGGVAHELNNALQPVRLMSDMLGDYVEGLPASDKAAAQTCLDTIDNQILYTRSIVSQILDFSKPAGTSVSQYWLPEIVKDTLAFAEGFLPAGVSMQCHWPPAQSDPMKNAMANLDPTGLKQIFVNLFTNASYAMNGSGSLTVELDVVTVNGDQSGQLTLLPGRYACISVSDTGHGISQEDLPHIFDPFFTKKPVTQGTGLGLATVQGTLASWKGGIAVSSVLGSGTTFRVYLPITIDGGHSGHDTSY